MEEAVLAETSGRPRLNDYSPLSEADFGDRRGDLHCALPKQTHGMVQARVRWKAFVLISPSTVWPT